MYLHGVQKWKGIKTGYLHTVTHVRQHKHTWVSPVELEGDWADTEPECPLVWGGLDWWESRELVPIFGGTGDRSISSMPSSESMYTSFKSKLFVLICPAVLSLASEWAGGLFRMQGFEDDVICMSPPLASSALRPCPGISGTGTEWCCLQGFAGPCVPLESKVETNSEFPSEVPAFRELGGSCKMPGIFLPPCSPVWLARLLRRWDSRSWSVVWSDLLATIHERQRHSSHWSD